MSEGDIWWINIGENVGSEINGKGSQFSRPAVIYRKLSHTLFMAAPTTTKPKEGTWFVAIRQNGIDIRVCLHQMRIIDYRRLSSKLGSVDDADRERIYERFLNLYTNKYSPLSQEERGRGKIPNVKI